MVLFLFYRFALFRWVYLVCFSTHFIATKLTRKQLFLTYLGRTCARRIPILSVPVIIICSTIRRLVPIPRTRPNCIVNAIIRVTVVISDIRGEPATAIIISIGVAIAISGIITAGPTSAPAIIIIAGDAAAAVGPVAVVVIGGGRLG